VKSFTGPAIIIVGRVVSHYQAVSLNPLNLHQSSELPALV
jgi:siroheme synthase